MLQSGDGAFTCLGQCGPGCGCGPCRRGFAGATFPSVPVATYPSVPRPVFAPVIEGLGAGTIYPSVPVPTFAPVVEGLGLIAENNKKTALYGMLGAAIGGAAVGVISTPGMRRGRGKVVAISAAIPSMVALLAMNFAD